MHNSKYRRQIVRLLLAWLEDFVFELCDDGGDKLRVCVGEEGHGRHQGAAIEIYHILNEGEGAE